MKKLLNYFTLLFAPIVISVILAYINLYGAQIYLTQVNFTNYIKFIVVVSPVVGFALIVSLLLSNSHMNLKSFTLMLLINLFIFFAIPNNSIIVIEAKGTFIQILGCYLGWIFYYIYNKKF